jgi:hypothetical protein
VAFELEGIRGVLGARNGLGIQGYVPLKIPTTAWLGAFSFLSKVKVRGFARLRFELTTVLTKEKVMNLTFTLVKLGSSERK